MDVANPATEAKHTSNQLSRVAWAIALFTVTMVAMAIRWYYLTHAMVYHPLRADAIQYHAYAWNLLHHGVFSMAAPHSALVLGDSYRDPGYPLFLAGAMKLGGEQGWYALALLTQGLLGALTVTLLMTGARRWLPDRWLIAAGMLMALWPHSITTSSFLLTETQFGFLCALAFCLLALAGRRHSTAYAASAGVAFGLASLTNAIALPFAPLLAGFLLLRGRLPRGMAVALALGALVLPAAWSVRNLQLPAGASSTGRALTNLDQGSWPQYHAGYRLYIEGRPEGGQILQAISQETDTLVADPHAGLALMADRMMQQPMHYLGWYLSKPALLWGWSIRMGQGDIYAYPTLHSPFSDDWPMRVWVSVCHSLNPLLMALGLIGCLLALGKNTPVNAAAAAGLALYVTALYSLLQAEPRYSIPFRGFECLLALYGGQRLYHWVLWRRQLSKRVQADPTRGVTAITTPEAGA